MTSNNTFSLAIEAADRLMFLAAMGRLDNETLAAAAAEKEGIFLPLSAVEAPSEPPAEAKEDEEEVQVAVVEPPQHLRACRRRARRRERANQAVTRQIVAHREERERKALERRSNGPLVVVRKKTDPARWANRVMVATQADEAWMAKYGHKRHFVRFMLSGVSRRGAEALVRQGMKEFQQGTGVSLPWNLYKDGPLIACSKRKRLYGVNDCVEHYARLGGFLRKAATSPAARPLVRFIAKATSNRGQGSRRTILNLTKLPVAFGSPEAASRKLVAIRRRANEILEPYGVRVSNEALASVMTRFRRTGKAAHQAAMVTLRVVLSKRFGIASYGMSREVIFMAACGMKAALREERESRERLGFLINGKEVSNLRAAIAAQHQIAA